MPLAPETDDVVPLDRGRLASVPWTLIHSARSMTQANIHGLEWQGQRLAIKDFGGRAWPLRATVGRWTIRKEARVYAMLRGIEGVPRVHGVIAGPALVMEWLPIRRLPDRREGALTPAFFDALDHLLEEIHARGVAHGDIRRKNIAIGDDGLPRLIDFTTAFTCPPGAWWPRRTLMRHVRLVDRITALRIRQSFFPELPLTEEQRALLESEPRLHRFGRWLRQRVYRPFKKRVLRR